MSSQFVRGNGRRDRNRHRRSTVTQGVLRATLHIYDAGDHLFFVGGLAFDQSDRLPLVFHSGPYNRQISDVIAGQSASEFVLNWA